MQVELRMTIKRFGKPSLEYVRWVDIPEGLTLEQRQQVAEEALEEFRDDYVTTAYQIIGSPEQGKQTQAEA